MATQYDRRRAHREAQRQRALMGETLTQFHARENPAREAPGARLPHKRCRETDDLFSQRPQLFDRDWNDRS